MVKYMHEIDLSKYTPHTDLITDHVKEKIDNQGVLRNNREIGNINIEETIITEEAPSEFKDKVGTYYTISFEDITDKTNFRKVEDVFSSTIKDLLTKLKIKKKDKCLIIGLGNKNSTPDALGPLSCEHLIVTGHLFQLNLDVDKNYRYVSCLAPGVMATTGIETGDIIEGIIKETHPDFVIVIDALASTSLDRVNKTIQLTDTGIKPGSGVGNSRQEISKETLGIPVIAIGIPTVVDAVTIVSDTIRFMLSKFSYNKDNIDKAKSKFINLANANYLEHEEHLTEEDKMRLLGLIGTLSEDDKKSLIHEVLSPIGYNLMVTPKEIDFLIERLALLLGKGLNRSLHNITE